MDSVRIDSFLAHNGLCARRKAADFLNSHTVEWQNNRLTEPGARISGTAPLYIDGRPFSKKTRFHYFLLNKPAGYLSSSSDPQNRPLALQLIKESSDIRLHSVGRLDYNSSGMLIFTDDGAFTYKLSHPSFEIEKEYTVTTHRPFPPAFLDSFRKGLNIEGILYKIKRYKILKTDGAGHVKTVNLTLTEGKNREIRRLFEFYRYDILILKRIRIGNLCLEKLKEGAYRPLNHKEIKMLTQNKS
jgi:23S rRNA pseudouridine2605 synthase